MLVSQEYTHTITYINIAMLPLWIVIIQPFSLETANDDKDAIEHSNDA